MLFCSNISKMTDYYNVSERDQVRYAVRCGYSAIEDLQWFDTDIIKSRIPGIPDKISCRCKGCGGALEEVVDIQDLKGRKKGEEEKKNDN